MRKGLLVLAAGVGLCAAYVLARGALIETGRGVIVLRTQEPDGDWVQARLWIIDDAGFAWLHGNRGSRWMDNLEARPLVELVRAGETHRYRATQVPGPHPRVHELLRAKVRRRGPLGALRRKGHRDHGPGPAGAAASRVARAGSAGSGAPARMPRRRD